MDFNFHNKYKKIDIMSYKIIEYLMTNNEDLWKLLKYNSSNALNQSDLSKEEKSDLIYKPNRAESEYRVFLKRFIDDAFDSQQSQLRIYTTQIIPTNRVYGCIDVCIDVLSHNKIIDLDNYKNRVEVMTQQVIQSLNGKDVGGVGLLTFDYKKNTSNRAILTPFNKHFDGFRIIMSTYSQ